MRGVFMANEQFTKSQKKRASQLKQDKLYRQGGWKKAVPLGRTFADYENHLFAFLIDLNICLLPVYLWGIEFILILTGLISPLYFDLLFYLMYGALFLTSVVLLPLYTAANHGQTFGDKIIGLKIVRRSRRPASAMVLILAQVIGFGLPLMLFGYFFSVFGLLIWWAVNGLVVLISPHQQTIADWIFGLVEVYTPEFRLASAEELQQPQAEPEPESEKEPQKEPEPEPEPAKEDGFSPIDLHIRSNYSDDALLDVEEIFRQARDQGMEVISITDHNCARANAQAVRFAPLYGIQYIPGVEFDVEYRGCRARILGYYIDWNNPVFDQLERDSLRREREASIARVRAFEQLTGLRIDVNSIFQKSRFQTITGRDLTYMVFRNQKTRQLPLVQSYLQRFPTEEEAQKAFRKDIFKKGGPCYVDIQYPDASVVIKAIHDVGGMAVLSGWRIDEMSNEAFDGLMDEGIDGLEVFNPHLSVPTQTFLLTMSQQEKLFVTAGSDYHGTPDKPEKLGYTGCPAKGLSTVRVFTRALDSLSEPGRGGHSPSGSIRTGQKH